MIEKKFLTLAEELLNWRRPWNADESALSKANIHLKLFK